MADFTVRQGDNFTLADTLEDAAGAAVDIQGATIKLTLIPIGGGTPLLNAATATNAQNGTGVDGSKGKVTYSGGGATTATPGYYLASWIVTFAGGLIQTYPNGGYVLFQVTDDVPVSALTRFAESSDLERRLGLTFTADEHVRAQHLLELATGLIQDETKQTIALVTGDTLTIPSTFEDRIRLPERPVVSVASVSIDGVALATPLEYYLEADSLVRANWSMLAERHFFASSGGWGGPLRTLTIVYTHGFSAIPPLVKAICMEAVVRVWVNPGAVIAEGVGDTHVQYSQRSGAEEPMGLLLTEAEIKRLNDTLRRVSGSIGLR